MEDGRTGFKTKEKKLKDLVRFNKSAATQMSDNLQKKKLLGKHITMSARRTI